MAGTKTNERPGTRAQARYVRMSAFKVRPVLDRIRGLPTGAAEDVLATIDRDAAGEVRKTLNSAIANATNNDEQDPETLQVVACYADEGPTIRRFRPRARGRATRINKRTSHITVIVARMSAEDLARRAEAAEQAGAGGRSSRADRRARVAKSRQAEAAAGSAGAGEGQPDEAEPDGVDAEESAAQESAAEESGTAGDATTPDEPAAERAGADAHAGAAGAESDGTGGSEVDTDPDEKSD